MIRRLMVSLTTVILIGSFYSFIGNNKNSQTVVIQNTKGIEKGGKFQALLPIESLNNKTSIIMNIFKHSTKLWKKDTFESDSKGNTKLPSSLSLGTQKPNIQNISTKHSVFNSLTEKMTIVTAYFNLGSFRIKFGETVAPKLYFTWSKTFAYLVNPLVIYTDCQEFADLMKKHRQKFPSKTVIKRIQRGDIWAFRYVDKIKAVYSQPDYPKHNPKTASPAYSCAQHSKSSVVADAVRQNYFNTEFYAWLDIGYFRHIASNRTYFRLDAPSDIDRNKLVVNRIYNRSFSEWPYDILRRRIVWVGGGMFIGTKEIVLKFEKLYQKAFNYFLSKNLTNTDEQIIYSMYTNEGRAALKPDIELQLIISTGNGTPWFYMGYLCRHVLTNLTVQSHDDLSTI